MKLVKVIFLLFYVLNSEFSQANTGIDKSVYDVKSDAKNRLWVATTTGLLRFNGKWENWSETKDSPFYGKYWFNVVEFVERGNHELILGGTERDGLYIYNLANKKMAHILNNMNILKLLVDKTGDRVYVATDSGLYRYDIEYKRIKTIISKKSIFSLTFFNDKIVYISREGIGYAEGGYNNEEITLFKGLKDMVAIDNYIFATTNDGLIKFNKNLNIVNHFYKGYVFDSVIHTSSEDTIWIGGNDKLIKFNYRNNGSIRHDFIDNCFGRIFSLHENSVGNVLVGSENGLVNLSKGVSKLNQCKRNYFLAKYKQDKYFIIKERFGVQLYDAKKNTIEEISTYIDFKDLIITFVSYNKGNLWISTQQGLKVINIEGEQPLIPSEALESSTLFTTFNSDKKLFIGKGNKGLFIYNFYTKDLVNFSIENGLKSNDVLYALETDDGSLWVSAGYHLHVKNPKDSFFNSIYKSNSKITTIEEHNENIYLSTMSNGFISLDKESFKVKNHYNSNNNFISNITSGVFKNGGILYLQTEDEIRALNLFTQKFEYSFPVNSRVFTHNTFIKLEDNRALTANPKTGIDVIQLPSPKKYKDDKTIIIDVLIDGAHVNFNDHIDLARDNESVQILFNRKDSLPMNKLICKIQVNGGKEFRLEQGRYIHKMNNFSFGRDIHVSSRCANEFGDWDKKYAKITLKIPVSSSMLFLTSFFILIIICACIWLRKIRLQISDKSSHINELEKVLESYFSIIPEKVSPDVLNETLEKICKNFHEKYGIKPLLVKDLSELCDRLDAHRITAILSAGLAITSTDRTKREVILNFHARGDYMRFSITDESKALVDHKRRNTQGWKNFIRCYESFDNKKWNKNIYSKKTFMGNEIRIDLKNKSIMAFE